MTDGECAAQMQYLGELEGRPCYWAQPGHFKVPGFYFWDGKNNIHVHLKDLPGNDDLGDELLPETPRGRAAAVLRRATEKGVKLRAYTGDIGILIDEIAAEIQK